MKIKGLLATEMSGSIAGITASHNRGGQYFRARAVPVNPSSIYQQSIRGALSFLATNWFNTLTGTQRAAWDTYGKNVPTVDRLGESRLLTGLNWYIACNVSRYQAGLAYVHTAPTDFTMAQLTQPVITSATAATETFAFTFLNTDEWATAVGGALLLYTARPQNSSCESYKGPYRYAGKVAGAVSPPSSPGSIVAAFPFEVGQRIHTCFRAVNADGRISPSFRLSALGV